MSGAPYPTPPKREVPELVPKKKAYKAIVGFGAGEQKERFRIVDKEGGFDFFSYSHLLEGSLHKGILTLSMTTRGYILTGKGLETIVDALSNRKAKAICAFNPDTHETVTDPNATIIKSIEDVEE